VSKGRVHSVALLALALMLLLGSAVTSRSLLHLRDAYVPLRTRVLHMPLAGFEPVVADMLWIRLVQYMGQQTEDDQDLYMRNVQAKLDTITRLDPRFVIVYHYGVLTLMVSSPDDALKLLDRGLAHIPEDDYDWRLPFYGAFISARYSEEPGRYERSLKWLSYVDEQAESPGFVVRFRPRLMEKQEDFEGALLLWYDLYENCSAPQDRAIVERGLLRAATRVREQSANDSVRKLAESLLQPRDGPLPQNEGGEEDP